MAARPRPIDPAALARARRSTLPEPVLALVVGTFEALADSTRVRILYALQKGSLSVRDLAAIARVSESAVSHQLRFLRDRRWVKFRRTGNVVRYAIDDHHLAALFREAEYHADHVRHGRPDHPDAR